MRADTAGRILVVGGLPPLLLLVLGGRAIAVSPCDVVPGPARLACEGASGVTNGIGGAVQGAATSAADTAIGGLASAFAEAGAFFLGKLAELLGSTTQIDVGADWFTQRYAVMFGISAILTFCLLLLSVVKAVLRGDGMEAIKSGTMYYVAAVVASAFAPALVYLLVQLSDAVTAALMFGAEDETKQFLTGTGETLVKVGLVNPVGGAATVLITALVTIFCSVILWLELLLRTAIIYVATLFAAPTFAGLVDKALWKHARRWIYFTISVIFAKPVVVAVLGLAAAGAGNAGTSDGFSSVFVALALMIVSIFCVGLLFRVIPNAGDEIAGALTARREINSSTPHSPLPGPGMVVRQSVQSHLVRGAARSGASRGALVGAGAVAAPVAAATVAGATAHRAGTAAAQGARAGGGAGGPTAPAPARPAPTRLDTKGNDR